MQAWLGLGCRVGARASPPRIVTQAIRLPSAATAAAINIAVWYPSEKAPGPTAMLALRPAAAGSAAEANSCASRATALFTAEAIPARSSGRAPSTAVVSQHDEPGAEDDWADGHRDTGADSLPQPARLRGEAEHDDRRRQRSRPGGEGGVAEHVLELQREEEEHGADGDVVGERCGVGAGELARAEDRQRQHRVARTALEEQEGDHE